MYLWSSFLLYNKGDDNRKMFLLDLFSSTIAHQLKKEKIMRLDHQASIFAPIVVVILILIIVLNRNGRIRSIIRPWRTKNSDQPVEEGPPPYHVAVNLPGNTPRVENSRREFNARRPYDRFFVTRNAQ